MDKVKMGFAVAAACPFMVLGGLAYLAWTGVIAGWEWGKYLGGKL
jgi:hypothetical protein